MKDAGQEKAHAASLPRSTSGNRNARRNALTVVLVKAKNANSEVKAAKKAVKDAKKKKKSAEEIFKSIEEAKKSTEEANEGQAGSEPPKKKKKTAARNDLTLVNAMPTP